MPVPGPAPFAWTAWTTYRVIACAVCGGHLALRPGEPDPDGCPGYPDFCRVAPGEATTKRTWTPCCEVPAANEYAALDEVPYVEHHRWCQCSECARRLEAQRDADSTPEAQRRARMARRRRHVAVPGLARRGDW